MTDRPTDRFFFTLKTNDLVIYPARFDCFGAGRIVEDPNPIPGFVALKPLEGKHTVTVQARNTIKVNDDR